MPEIESDDVDLLCTACGRSFPVPASLAGKSERCPHCDTLNDVPIPDDLAEELQNFDPSEALGKPANRKFNLIWTLVSVLGFAGFAVVVWHIYRPTWEQRHVDQLLAAYQQADADYRGGEFRKAADEYQSILTTVGDRQLKSLVLQQLVRDSRERQGQSRFELQTTKPTSRP